MIRVSRSEEPDELRKIRQTKLPELIRLSSTKAISSEDIDGYKIVAELLWKAQHYKCCYCERKITKAFNDVEHYRPKAYANRQPGSKDTHGYWWLAFTWGNLLFACPSCNRSHKKSSFPLASGSVALLPLQPPPGSESAFLINPAEENGVEHIEFGFSITSSTLHTKSGLGGGERRWSWRPRARGGSIYGDWSIRVYRLDSTEFVELYDDHVNKEVRPVVKDLQAAVDTRANVIAAFERAMRLLLPGRPFVGLSYDALRLLLPDSRLAAWRVKWPKPCEVGRLALKQRK